MKIKAVSENLRTGKRRKIDMEVELFSNDDGEVYFQITKGGTGREGFDSIALYVLSQRKDIQEKGWVVHTGMLNYCDRIVIPPCQLDILLAEVGL